MSVLRIVALVAIARVAAADPSQAEMQQAKVLFERGRELVKQNDHARACPLFEESERIVPALGTELNIAQCWQATGKLLAARDLFKSVLERAKIAKQQPRVDLAQKGLDELATQLPKLEIKLVGTGSVTLDGKPVEITAPIEVDPGTHKLAAAGAQNQRKDSKEVEAKAGQVTPVTLDVSAPVTTGPPGSPVATERVSGPRTRRKLAYALGATGGVALIGSLLAGGVARHRAKALDNCDVFDNEAICFPDDAAKVESAKDIAGKSSLLFLIGAGALTAATVVYVTSPRETRIKQVVVGVHPTGVTLEARW